MSGQGTMYYADGAKYEGGWQYNKKHGEGILTTPDGKTIKGEWDWKEGKLIKEY